MKHVIIGAGVAGITAARTIKEFDRDAEVEVIGEEMFLPYKRYLLTEFVCGSVKKEELIFFPMKLMKELGIKFRKGQYVKTIEHSKKIIKLLHNEVVHYDKLLIATGGRPGLGLVLRPYDKHIQCYYSMNDILVLKTRLSQIKKCIVSGDGVSCLDLISGLYNLGKRVIYITKSKRAAFALKKDVFEGELHDFLKERGIEIITEDQIVSVDMSGHCYSVETLKKKTLTADIVFAWDYYTPNITCIEGTSIEKRQGILVNTRMETSAEHIYAAGDCVEIYHPFIRNYWINFGLPNAFEQGSIAGKNMSGHDEEYKIRDAIVFNLMGKSLRARWWK